MGPVGPRAFVFGRSWPVGLSPDVRAFRLPFLDLFPHNRLPLRLIFLPKSTNLSTMEQNPILDLFSLTNADAQMIVVGTIFLFGLYFALRASLFKPLLAHLEERESVTAGAVHTASQMRQKAQALRVRYDEGMLQARVAANKERQTAVAKAKATASSIVAEAEAKAAQELQVGRKSIDSALQQAYAKAEGEAQALAETLTTKVDSQLTVH